MHLETEEGVVRKTHCQLVSEAIQNVMMAFILIIEHRLRQCHYNSLLLVTLLGNVGFLLVVIPYSCLLLLRFHTLLVENFIYSSQIVSHLIDCVQITLDFLKFVVGRELIFSNVVGAGEYRRLLLEVGRLDRIQLF